MTRGNWKIPEGTPTTTCRGCGAEIYMVAYKRKSGPKAGEWGRMPVNPDGIVHWATCPKAAGFRGAKT